MRCFSKTVQRNTEGVTGHKSYECKVKNGGGARKEEKKQTSKLSNTYTNKVDKKASTPYLS